MNWKVRQLKREEEKTSVYCNLTNDSIGWHIRNYHSDKILRDIIFNLSKKIYLSEIREYIIKLNALPDNYEVTEKIEELEIMFMAIEKRSKK